MFIPDDIADHAISLKDQYFDFRGLSTYSALGVGTLRDYVKTGGLPCFRLRGKILIKKSEFDEWIETFRLNRKKELNGIVDYVLNTLAR